MAEYCRISGVVGSVIRQWSVGSGQWAVIGRGQRHTHILPTDHCPLTTVLARIIATTLPVLSVENWSLSPSCDNSLRQWNCAKTLSPPPGYSPATIFRKPRPVPPPSVGFAPARRTACSRSPAALPFRGREARGQPAPSSTPPPFITSRARS